MITKQEQARTRMGSCVNYAGIATACRTFLPFFQPWYVIDGPVWNSCVIISAIGPSFSSPTIFNKGCVLCESRELRAAMRMSLLVDWVADQRTTFGVVDWVMIMMYGQNEDCRTQQTAAGSDLSRTILWSHPCLATTRTPPPDQAVQCTPPATYYTLHYSHLSARIYATS